MLTSHTVGLPYILSIIDVGVGGEIEGEGLAPKNSVQIFFGQLSFRISVFG